MRYIAEAEPITMPYPVMGNQQVRKPTPLWLQAQRVLEHTPVAVMAVAVGLVTLLIHGYHLSAGPDVFGDEGNYLVIGINVATGVGLITNKFSGFFFYHPPAYYLAEAAYIKLTGLTNTDLLATQLSVRYLNIFFSASTAALLMLFGQKLHSYKAGLLMAVLFIIDPYVQRINRHGMLETMAMLCALLGLYIFFTYRRRLTTWQRLGSGIAFGLAMLTKEPMFLELCALIVYVLCFRRSQLRDVASVSAIACTVYLIYPAWVFAVGQENKYLSFKLFGLKRFLSYITGQSPPTPPDGSYSLIVKSVPFLNNLENLLIQYGTSYLLIALAAFFTIILILRCRHLVAARYLIIWNIFSIGFGLGLGRTDDQYFYYLIVPSIIVAGYTLASLLEIAFSHSSWQTPTFRPSPPLFSQSSIGFRIICKPICAAFVVILLLNSYLWVKNYVVGSDNASIKVIQYVRTHIPQGETIFVSNDATFWYLSPWYNMQFEAATPQIDSHIHYYILSSKDALDGYNGLTLQFYNSVIQSSQLLFEEQGSSFGEVGVYQLTPRTILPSTPPSIATPISLYRSYFGVLYDTPTGLRTNISLTNIRLHKWNISGDFSKWSANSRSNAKPEHSSFSGTFNAARHFQFIVARSAGQAFVSFQGNIQPDGSIAGTYSSSETRRKCGNQESPAAGTYSSSETATGTCSDYGLWNIVPRVRQ